MFYASGHKCAAAPSELYPRVGFIVTNLTRPVQRVVAFYNQRGTGEQWIKEGKGAIKWTRLSCRTFAANAVRLQLHALAYNLGNFMRTLAMPKTPEPWSMTSLREKLAQSRCEGHQPRPLCHLSDGRGRSATTDVQRNPHTHCPVAGATRSSVKPPRDQMDGQRRQRRALMKTNQRAPDPRGKRPIVCAAHDTRRGGRFL